MTKAPTGPTGWVRRARYADAKMADSSITIIATGKRSVRIAYSAEREEALAPFLIARG